MRTSVLFLSAVISLAQYGPVAAQSLTGALIGTVKDAQDRVVQGAVIRVSSTGESLPACSCCKVSITSSG
jgi:hypothetical protein